MSGFVDSGLPALNLLPICISRIVMFTCKPSQQKEFTSRELSIHRAGAMQHDASRPLSMVAVVAALRYNHFACPGVYMQGATRWVLVHKLWSSKRRFCLRTSLQEFTACMQQDPTRFRVEEFDGEMWVSAV